MDDDEFYQRFGSSEWPDLEPRRTPREWFLTVVLPPMECAVIAMIFFLIWDKVV